MTATTQPANALAALAEPMQSQCQQIPYREEMLG
jgi:hypothetical protein